MRNVLIATIAVVAIFVVALIVLGTIDIPAPSAQIERPIPASRLPH